MNLEDDFIVLVLHLSPIEFSELRGGTVSNCWIANYNMTLLNLNQIAQVLRGQPMYSLRLKREGKDLKPNSEPNWQTVKSL